MKSEIIKRLAMGPVWLKKLAVELDVSYYQLLVSCPTSIVMHYPVKKLDELLQLFCSWDKVTLVVQSSGFTVEVHDYFPAGEYGRRCYNMHSSTTSIGGHLDVSKVASILLVKDFAYGRVSYSAKFFTEEGQPILTVYLPRDGDKKLIISSLNEFLQLAQFSSSESL